MTWTYGGNPQNSDLDRLRFLCGDTQQADPLITDEELNFLLGRAGSPEAAAPEAAQAIMLKLSREVDYTLGPEQVKASQRLTNYQKVWNALQASRVRKYAAPSWQPPTGSPGIFDVGMHDNRKGG